MTRLIQNKGLTREEWLEERRKGIGGSDVAAAMGISKFKDRTPLALWQDKLGIGKPDQESEAKYWGTVLEDIVAKDFQRRTGMKVQKFGYTFVDGNEDWMRANIDRAIVNPAISGNVRPEKDPQKTGRLFTTDAILECKTADAHAASEWGDSQIDEIKAGVVVTDHKIPLYYETQVQWYMRLTGVSVCYVAVLIGGNDFRVYRVDRNNDVIAAIETKCRAFWFDYVKTKQAPPPVNIEDIRRLYQMDSGEMIEATNEAAVAIGEYRNLKMQLDGLQAQADAVKTKVATLIGESSGITLGGEKAVTFKAQSRATFDVARLKAEHPEIWVKYAGRSDPTRTLRFY